MNIAGVVAASYLTAQQRAIEVTAMNLANVNTPGYQATRVQFSAWLDAQPSAAAPPGGTRIAYAQDRATWRDTQPGPQTQTGNPFDIALKGDGYFTVATANGPRLTRDGRFGPLADGTIADGNGDALLDTAGNPIRIGPTDTQITIAGDGSVSSENGQLGQIGVVMPANQNAMQAEGGTLLRTDSPTNPVTAPGVVQGVVEGSNVPAVLEITRLVNDQRDFQFVTQLIQSEDDRIQSTIDKTLSTSA